MAKSLYTILVVIAALHAAAAGPLQAKFSQQITFKKFEQFNTYTYTDDQPNLLLTDVNGVCKTGVWIIYPGENYDYDYESGEQFGMIEMFPYLEYLCYSREKEVRSTRFVGSRTNLGAPMVTIFDKDSFRGNATRFEEQLANISNPISSIITIGAHVELFQDTNFGGESLCLGASPMGCTPQNVCWFWNFTDHDFPWDISTARSAKTGCSPTAKVYNQTTNINSGSVMTNN